VTMAINRNQQGGAGMPGLGPYEDPAPRLTTLRSAHGPDVRRTPPRPARSSLRGVVT
jgi:hypothetical protein